MASFSRAFRADTWLLWRTARIANVIPAAASTPTRTHTHGRRQMGGLRTTSGRRGAAATARRPRARPLLLMAM
jgi:hypothetical protein